MYESDALAPGTAAVAVAGVFSFNLSLILAILVLVTATAIIGCRYSRRGPCELRDLEAGEMRSRPRPLNRYGVLTWLAVASMVLVGVLFHVVAL